MYRQMATAQSITYATKEDQKEKRSAIKDGTSPVKDGLSAGLDFSELTPSTFGISVGSFIPSSSDRKEKSRLAQIKARRRSSVGVRGSPETNSLICFMARQRMKTPPVSQTPEIVRGSPFFPQVASTLSQKMASFQSLMDVAESDACDPMPVQDCDSGGCIRTGDYLSDGISCSAGKENNPPMTHTPSKRRCGGLLKACVVEIREAKPPLSLPHLKNQDAVCQPRCDGLAFASPPQQSSPFHIPSLPSQLEMEAAEEEESSRASTVKKKKRVRFGDSLSPEFFDKNLPPSTPLQKGGTPARAPTPGGSLQLRSVLKTPQRSQSETLSSQPEPHSPTGFDNSPVFKIPTKHRKLSEGGDGGQMDGEIVFPSMEEIDLAVTNDAECVFDVQPLNLDTAFHEESLSQTLTEFETKPGETSRIDVLCECESEPEEKQTESDVKSSTPEPSRNRKRKKRPEQLPTAEAQSHSSKQERKRPTLSLGQRQTNSLFLLQPKESEPVKRLTRSAAKSACKKMKVTSKDNKRWNKDVDHSLYGSREYASKNPTLSPIAEMLSFSSQETATGCTALNQEFLIKPEVANDTEAGGDLAVTKTLENPSLDSVEGKSNGMLGLTVRKRGPKKRKVSVADSEEPQVQTEKHTKNFEDQTTSSLEVSSGNLSKCSEPGQKEADIEELPAQTSSDTPCTVPEKSEYHPSLHAPPSDSPPSDDESSNTEPEHKQAKRGRRSSKLQQPQMYRAKLQTNCDVDESRLGNQAASQQEIVPSSQEEGGVAYANLAPWQDDFNFEDIFKPIVTRERRSVRRSLRNQNNTEHSSNSAGLTWLPHTSPDSVKETRRRTRARRLSAAPPTQPPPPEEMQDASSNELTVKGEN
ncbi:cell division cycle-associated protein 2 isoform X2 [Melanotaenia boesemani]|uniref:cell division cycle-associated protein 2 isoform X2 n=1 Tax=Melanotaenia boesemani TaxID=1250792 RepID=UPI001C05C2C8|nr:cell division cycle-associated protein 2 isoform X2 [Melanotaenia boesemani]